MGYGKGGETMTFNQVRRCRKVLDFKQQELAVQAHISPALLVAVERYGYLPSPEVRAKLAKALNTSESVLWPDIEATEVK